MAIQPTKGGVMSQQIENLRLAMRQAGIVLDGQIQADGKLHRFCSGGDKAPNSWYVMHSAPLLCGVFGCWKLGVKETWHAQDKALTQSDWNSIRSQWQKAEEERLRAEAENNEQSRQSADRIFSQAGTPESHPYLSAKCVKPLGDIRMHDGKLLVPLQDAVGKRWSIQFIGHDGQKRFLTGGRVAGCYFPIPGPEESPLLVVEGFATGASVHLATGFQVFCAMNCGNLMAVTQIARAKFQNREIIVCGDDDFLTEGNPGRTKAAEAALKTGSRLALPQFTNRSKETDFNDLHCVAGLQTVKDQVINSTPPKETDQEMIARLASLSAIDYEKVREKEADKIPMRVSILDALVTQKRTETAENKDLNGAKAEPWNEPVDGCQLLNEIRMTLGRFTILPDHADVALSLWVLHTYVFERQFYSPIIALLSPEKRCGKSVTLRALEALVKDPLASSSASGPVLFRSIEKWKPTLLIDEFDSLGEGDKLESIRNVLNSGHHRNGYVHRCIGDDNEPTKFSTYGPKLVCAIGSLPETVLDRSIVVRMRRKLKEERVERFRRFNGTEIQSKGLRWAQDNAAAIESADPDIPEALNDRAADGWESLLAVADLCGQEWGDAAREAAIALSTTPAESGDNVRVELLKDVRKSFSARGCSRIFTHSLLADLNGLDDRPWRTFSKGYPLDAHRLGKMLQPFDVRPGTVRIGDETAKGYSLESFQDAFGRYAPEETPLVAVTPSQSPKTLVESDFLHPSHVNGCDGSESEGNPNRINGCDDVTDVQGGEAGEHTNPEGGKPVEEAF